MGDQKCTLLVFVNSVCGCAAGNARPALRQALQHTVRPQQVVTVFAGQDVEATARARQYLGEYQPSSPSMALLRDGEVVHFVHRHQIEGRSPQAVAADLTAAFDRHFGAAV
jgi:putative YphP/YqiW family bacilliredoxin